MAWSRWTGAAFLAGIVVAGVDRAPAVAFEGAQDEAVPADAPWLRFETPIADSIEPAVEKYVREHFAPCGATGDAVPCFPVTLEVKGRQYSVRKTFDTFNSTPDLSPGHPRPRRR